MSKKRFAKVLTGIALLGTLVAGMLCLSTACNSPSTGDGCEHTDTQTINTATCVQDGVEKVVCKKCNATVSEQPVSALGHQMAEIASTRVPSTCTEKGQVDRKCTRCNEEDTVEFALLQHNYVKDETRTVEVSCETAGSETYVCSTCNDEYDVAIAATGHSFVVSEELSVAATCTTAGKVVKVCQNENCGEAVDSQILAALGHQWEGFACTGRSCTREGCSASEPASAPHDYEYSQQASTPATCETDGEDVEICTICQIATQRETVEASGHIFTGEWTDDGSPMLTDANSCLYAQNQVNFCEACYQNVYRTKEYELHDYKQAITKEATCYEAGEKKFVCAFCGGLQPDTSVTTFFLEHAWGEGVSTVDGSGSTQYTCTVTGCGATRVEYTSTSATVDATVLDNELTLKDGADGDATSIKLDDATKQQLNGKTDLTVSIGKIDNSTLGAEAAERVGDAPVYDFTMQESDGSYISNFDGLITIKLPYVLGLDENPDEITIFYINDNGVLEDLKGVYSDGYVTVQTQHFSYYTVVKYNNPAEICARYGHNWFVQSKPATCVLPGYFIKSCTRCGAQDEENPTQLNIPALGHQLVSDVDNSVDATCTESGLQRQLCEREGCSFVYEKVLSALGHSWEELVNVSATCTAAGHIDRECSVCEASYREDIPQTAHSYVKAVTPATCTTGGFTTYTCATCEGSYKADYKDALGHTWDIAAANCGRGQYCLVCNKQGNPATGLHNMVEGTCTVCGNGCDHVYSITVDTQDATCTLAGFTTVECEKCGKENVQNYVAAKGHTEDALGLCVKCNVASEDFGKNVVNLLLSAGTGSYTFTVNEFTLAVNVVQSYVESGKTYTTTQDTVVENMTAYLVVSEGKMLVYGSGMAVSDVVENDESYTSTVPVEVYGDGETLYMITSNNYGVGVSAENIYIKMPYEYVVTNIMSSFGGVSEAPDYEYNEDIGGGEVSTPDVEEDFENGKVEALSALASDKVEIEVGGVTDGEMNGDYGDGEGDMSGSQGGMSLESLAQMVLSMVGEEQLQAILALVQENADELRGLLGKLVQTIVTSEVTEDGLTVLSVDMGKLYELNEYLYTLDVEGLFEVYFGEGAYDTVLDWVASLENYTVREMVAIIFEAIQPYGINQSFVFDLLEGIVANATGEAGFDLTAMLAGEMGDMTINHLVSMYVPGYEPEMGENGEMIPTFDLAAVVEAYKEQFRNVNVYEYAVTMLMNLPEDAAGEMVDAIYNSVKKYADPSIYSFKISVTAEGAIRAIDFALNNLAIEVVERDEYYDYAMSEVISASFTLTFEGEIPSLALDVYDKVQTQIVDDMAATIQAICAENEGEPFILETNSEYAYFVFTVTEEGILVTYVHEYEGETNIGLLNDAAVMFMQDCINTYKVSFADAGYTFIYNTALNEFGSNTAHQFVQIANPAGMPSSEDEVDCEEYYYVYEQCQQTDCGQIIRTDYYKQHGESEITATLLPGATLCEQGVKMEYFCSVCHEKQYEYTSNYHEETTIEELTFATPHGTMTAKIISCGCGYVQELLWNVSQADGCWFNSYADSSGENGDGSYYCRYNCTVSENGCGAYLLETITEGVLSKEFPCVVQRVSVFEVMRADGTQIGEDIVISKIYSTHDFGEDYDSQDGRECVNCDYKEVYNVEYDSFGREIFREVYTYWMGQYVEYELRTVEFFSDTSCECEVSYVYEYGAEPDTYQDERHAYAYVPVSEETCTQYGRHQEVCMVCDWSQEGYYVAPHGHYDHGDGVCIYCGLEGASNGPTVLEDLTYSAEYGSEGYLTVGYYSYAPVAFSANVYLVVPAAADSATGESAKVILPVSVEISSDYGYVEYNSGLIRIYAEELEARVFEMISADGSVDLSGAVIEIEIVPMNGDSTYVCTIGLTDLFA